MSQVNLTQHLDPQPTLALFLGGSGVKTGQKLLSLLQTVPPEARQLMETFFIDSQAPKIDHHTLSRHYCYRDLAMFDEPVYEAFREHRMPANLGAEPVQDSCDGCGITRIFGAASLAACRDDFEDLLDTAVDELKKSRSSPSQGLQVFITASSCGGTGAGMLIDAAALVRHHLTNSLGEQPRIFAFLLGPDAFVDDPKIPRGNHKERMQASAYALLKELHHFADGGVFESGYRLRDPPTEIRNESQGDRLFEWVFYVDGKTEAGQSTRSLDELTSIVAESQLHLAMSEVGHKIRESLPNQREERSRQYAIDYVHSANREGQSAVQRAQLKKSGRRSFLAGLSVRNIRFPAREIADFENARWTLDALSALLKRESTEDEASILVMDRLLGVEAGEGNGGGFLARAGAGRRQLEEHLSSGVWARRSGKADPAAAHDRGRSLLRTIDEMLRSRGNSAPENSDAFESWRYGWEEAFRAPDGIPGHLLELAGNPVDGRGLEWLHGFLDHVIAFLERPGPEPRLHDSWQNLESQLDDLRRRLQTLEKGLKRDESNFILRARGVFRLLTGESRDSRAWSQRTESLARRINKDLDLIAEAASTLQRERAVCTLERRAFLRMADDLKTWQREVLVPSLDKITTAMARSEGRLESAQANLGETQPSTGDARGAGSTMALVDSALLQELCSDIARSLSVVDLVVRPFFGQGLIHNSTRLQFETISDQTAIEVLDTVSHTVSRATEVVLARLDAGWLLPAVKRRLERAAALLDQGAEPLLAFSNAAVGARTWRYLLKPEELVLPRRFGRAVNQAQVFDGKDPLQLSIVSFVFGVPPNALLGIEAWFRQYCLYLGDNHSVPELDRFPLHVFRHAAQSFDEPYSPLVLATHPGYLEGLRTLIASPAWDPDIQLDVRPVEDLHATLKDRPDWNLVIELTDRIVRAARHRPALADWLQSDRRLAPIANRFRGRSDRASTDEETSIPKPTTGGGNDGQGMDPLDGHSPDGHNGHGDDSHLD